MTVGGARPAVGFSFGYCPALVGFEIEYAGNVGAASSSRPSAGGIFVNGIVQSRVKNNGRRYYAVVGFGLYGESQGAGFGSGEMTAAAIGGGVKIPVAGRLRLRLDYRLFLPGDAPDAARGFAVHAHPQRIAVGLGVDL